MGVGFGGGSGVGAERLGLIVNEIVLVRNLQPPLDSPCQDRSPIAYAMMMGLRVAADGLSSHNTSWTLSS